jgi:hypothetical protein
MDERNIPRRVSAPDRRVAAPPLESRHQEQGAGLSSRQYPYCSDGCGTAREPPDPDSAHLCSVTGTTAPGGAVSHCTHGFVVAAYTALWGIPQPAAEGLLLRAIGKRVLLQHARSLGPLVLHSRIRPPLIGTAALCALIGLGWDLLAAALHGVIYVFVLSLSINGLCHARGYRTFELANYPGAHACEARTALPNDRRHLIGYRCADLRSHLDRSPGKSNLSCSYGDDG